MTKNELCRQLALEFAKIAITHPEVLKENDKIINLGGTYQSTRVQFAQYYIESFNWYKKNFSTYIGTISLSDTEDQ